MSERPNTWSRDPYISGGFDPEGIIRTCSNGIRIPASFTVNASPGNSGTASRVQALRAELDAILFQRHATSEEAATHAASTAAALRSLLMAASVAGGLRADKTTAYEQDLVQVFGPAVRPSSPDLLSIGEHNIDLPSLNDVAATVFKSAASSLSTGARLDELLLAARALLLPEPDAWAADAALPAILNDDLRAGATRLRVVRPSALALELQRDSGLALRRVLHHGARVAPVASAAAVDHVQRETRRSADGFCTVGVFGAPVRSGAWFFEATVLAKEVGQVGLWGL